MNIMTFYSPNDMKIVLNNFLIQVSVTPALKRLGKGREED